MRFGKSLFSGCKELDGPEDGWSRGWMVVSGLRYRDQTNRNRPSSKRFIPILNSKKERIKELET